MALTKTPPALRERVRAPVRSVRQAVRWAKRERFPELPSDAAVLRKPALTLPTSMSPKVSVVIPVYGKFATTWACLQSIATTKTSVPFEVVVVDDASPDRTVEIMSHVSGLRLHRNPQNLGFIRSCNAGAAQAKGEWLCLLNNDTRVTDGWLDELLQTFELHPNTGMVGARLLFPDGRLQEAGGTVFRDGSASHFGRNRDPQRPEYSFVREVDFCSGACLLLRTEFYRSLGGFDEHYLPAYYEDADLAFRVRRTGLRVLYQPLCRVVHYEGITNGRDLRRGVKRYQVVNRDKFRERWQNLLLAEHPAPGRRSARSADRCVRPQLVIVPEPSSTIDAAHVQRMRELDSLGFKLSVVSHDAELARALGRLGIEPLAPPYCASVLELLSTERAAGVSLVWCEADAGLLDLHELIRTHAEHVKSIVNAPAGGANQPATIERLRGADLVLTHSGDSAAQWHNVAPYLRVVDGTSTSTVLASAFRDLLGRR